MANENNRRIIEINAMDEPTYEDIKRMEQDEDDEEEEENKKCFNPFLTTDNLFFAKTQENVCTVLGLGYIEWVKNLYSPYEVHTSYVLFTYDRIVYSQYE